jgi:hypothetical protein
LPLLTKYGQKTKFQVSASADMTDFLQKLLGQTIVSNKVLRVFNNIDFN